MLAYSQTGSGDPLVLVHGVAASKEIWQGVLPLLGHWRTIAIDVPGFGASPPAGDGFELDAVADAIWAGLPRDLGPVTLVGHSMGGAIALAAAARAPQLVRRLVLCAPAGLLPMPVPGQLLGPAGAVWDLAVNVRRHFAPLAAWSLGRRLLLGTTTAPGDTLTEREVRSIVRETAGATRTAAALRAVAHADLRPELAAVPCGVGLLWGSGDFMIPRRVVDAGVAARPDLALSTIDGTGHLPMLERPAEFVKAFDDLVVRLDRACADSGAGG